MATPRSTKDEEKISVYVRCRPMSAMESEKCCLSVVDFDGKSVVIKDRGSGNAMTKKFTFDRAFDQASTQTELYKAAVAPVVEEVISGYNCTIFAYGQTGTGKTYTMEGERTPGSSVSWENDSHAGIIPRSMAHLFHRLSMSECEYSVRVSFLELYNEELSDLLGNDDCSAKLRIFDDATRKGSVVIQGLEEVVVRNKEEVYSILEKGSLRRQTASTNLNAKSSRSHTVFTVTIHMKDNSMEGEELVKMGKLNLVDLAGSENIGRSGAIDKRAREAGSINQSLLTLGRVITSLVDHGPHVPYRESKLTRLLQDSLGGHTKTSIIATISPASVNIEETLSTLDYAHRAKNIQNKPEVNQRLTKKTLIKEYDEKIDRLRRELQAARDKNGVYLASDDYNDLHGRLEYQAAYIREKEARIGTMEQDMAKIQSLFEEHAQKHERTASKLAVTEKTLQEQSGKLSATERNLRRSEVVVGKQRQHIVKMTETGSQLAHQAEQLLQAAEQSTGDVAGLHDKLDRTRSVEEANSAAKAGFRGRLERSLKHLRDSATSMAKQHEATLDSACQMLTDVCAANEDSRKSTADMVNNLAVNLRSMGGELLLQVAAVSERMRRSEADEGAAWTSLAETFASMLASAVADVEGVQLAQAVALARQSEAVAALEAAASKMVDDQKREFERLLSRHTEDVSDIGQYVADEMDGLEETVSALQYSAIDRGSDHSCLHKDSMKELIHFKEETAHIMQRLSGLNGIASALEARMNRGEEMIAERVAADGRHLASMTSALCSVRGKMTEYESMQSQVTASARTRIEGLTKSQTEALGESCLALRCIGQQQEDQSAAVADRCKQHLLEMSEAASAARFSRSSQAELAAGEMVAAIDKLKASVSQSIDHGERSCTVINGSLGSGSAIVDGEVGCCQASLKESVTSLMSWTEDAVHALNEQQCDVEHFLEAELATVKPTGQTPQRRAFVYPHQIVPLTGCEELTDEADHDVSGLAATDGITSVCDSSWTSCKEGIDEASKENACNSSELSAKSSAVVVSVGTPHEKPGLQPMTMAPPSGTVGKQAAGLSKRQPLRQSNNTSSMNIK